ncbi:hypothetical protein SODALDRAFT_356283 [Sodiomyces alkalinus F11]|uniref:Inhibitor I9 domain-containing protein n=1 Tax=Sodiomyces alkalinus (strain CBS 110278 / VKM F-3762 / F11) TaxID=1314773 RepID=A0A3N2Q0M3_SODAK|nr:hypothetical protein SODALDRAFT_356283 [Sodiomyces alkalinus F11]ROT40313.1 hypothetical protein SODALDRAFT_356283 [Sodiomyces alkalinus F11]
MTCLVGGDGRGNKKFAGGRSTEADPNVVHLLVGSRTQRTSASNFRFYNEASSGQMQSTPRRPRSSSSDRAWDGHEESNNGTASSLIRTRSRQQRDLPPTLFLHPSPAASHASIPGITPMGGSSGPMPPLSQPPAGHQRDGSLTVTMPSASRAVGNLSTHESARSADRTDALWAEMQATLEEVELSASGGTHVFGPEHDRKLADLRKAQIALAQAWARSEADDAIGPGHRDNSAAAGSAPGGVGDEVRNMRSAALGETATTRKSGEGTDAAKSTAGTGSALPGSSGMAEGLDARFEEGTEADILLARRRREANDRYFQQVKGGVLDVVARLEDVAVAMRALEQETKDIWGEDGSLPGSAKTWCFWQAFSHQYLSTTYHGVGGVGLSLMVFLKLGVFARTFSFSLSPRLVILSNSPIPLRKTNKKLRANDVTLYTVLRKVEGEGVNECLTGTAFPTGQVKYDMKYHLSSGSPAFHLFRQHLAFRIPDFPTISLDLPIDTFVSRHTPTQPLPFLQTKVPSHSTHHITVAMKPSTFLVAALSLVPGALAVDKMKNVIVWAQDESITDSMLEKAKNAIIEAGGKVTHVYTLIRGFDAVAPAKALEVVQAFDAGIKIEEDQTVTIYEDEN